ncbi:glycosyl hydrolase family 61-domain-containing protein [Coniochaeta sp. 2T2.1]|nr:glycosyl hydrolase family 61-domain-containing protein [Coniochaeta sp. 2T2.1]
MKSFLLAAALAAREVASHAIFQQLWVDSSRHGSQCIRMPQSNTPVTNVGGNDVRCNVGGSRGVAKKCPVKAGSTVTVEMHQQPGDRSCGSEAIGGAHYGPVIVYLSKVPDSSTADGSAGWFKIFEDGWSAKSGGRVGDDDNWGVKDLNSCCGKMDVKIPSDIAPGDYLLRAEVIALHTAGQSGGAQLYMSCYQLTIDGTGSATPATVKFPGAYKASDPGIQVNIHAALSTYVVPGPPVYSGGTTKTPGSSCSGCAGSCKAGSGKTGTAVDAQPTSAAGGAGPDTSAGGAPAPGGEAGCAVQAFGQCGGNGYTGCTSCGSGATCKAVSPPYYSQCVPS